MLRQRHCAGLGCAWLFALAGTAIAQDATRIERLESRLAEQHDTLARLEMQLADGRAQDTDATRTAVLRAQLREILSEAEFRESLLGPTAQAGYDKGFFIRSSDEQFLMRINWQLQFRWTHYATRATNRYLSPGLQRDDRTGFDFARARFKLGGHVYSKDLTYLFEMTHAENSGYDLRSLYAWLNYRFSDAFQMTFGQMRVASTRAQMNAITTYQMVELPMTDAIFGCGCGVGARVWGELFDKRLTYWLDVVNSRNGPGNRTITPDPAELDGNPAVIFRAVWHALGDDPGNDFYAMSDIEHHESPALDLGLHYAFNEDEGDLATMRIPIKMPRRFGTGGFGLVSSNGLQTHQFGYEAAFKWRGFSAVSEFHVLHFDVRRAGRQPYSDYWLATGGGSDNTFYGGYLQVGYFLPIPGLERKLEAVARVEGLGGVDPGDEGTWIYAAGLNYYIRGNNIKLQTDVTKVSEVPISSSTYSLANVNDDALIWRIQLGLAF